MELNPHIGVDLNTFVKEKLKYIGGIINNRFGNVIRTGAFDREDLLGVALLGVTKAYMRYDPTKFDNVNKFDTYYPHYVIGEIQRHIRDTSLGAHYPRGVKELATKIRKMDWYNKDPEWIYQEIKQSEDYLRNHVSIKRVKEAFDFIRNGMPNSTNAVIYEDEDGGVTLGDTLGVYADYSTVIVNDFMKKLDKRERRVLDLTYDGISQKSIGAELGISQMHVSRIKKKIGEKLNKYLKKGEDEMPVSPKKFEKMKHLLAHTKLTYKEIEELTGVSQGTISKYRDFRPKEVRDELKARVNALRKPGMERQHKGDTDKAVEMLAKGGYTYADIERQTGVPSGSLTRLRRQYQAGEYQWVGGANKRVEIKQPEPVETPVIEVEAFMGEKDLAAKREREEKEVPVAPVVKELEKLGELEYSNYDPGKEYEMVEKNPSLAVNMAEAIENFKQETREEVINEIKEGKINPPIFFNGMTYEEASEFIKQQMTTTSEATEPSDEPKKEVGKINRKTTFKYEGDGEEISVEDIIAELQDIIQNLEASGNKTVNFSLKLQAE